MIPTDRKSFTQFCMRNLGSPVIKINLSEEQISDCVDQAFYLYQQYHFDATEKFFYTYQITNEDIANQYITMPENVIGAVKIFPIGQSIGTNSLFNMRYQFIINDLYNFSNVSLVPYYMTLQHVQFMEEMLVGQKPIRYNRHNNLLYIDMDWSIVVQGEYLIVECYGVIDPTEYQDVWSDKWLQDYCTELIKKKWAQTLSVFRGVMPSGLLVRGPEMYAEAVQEIEKLKIELYRNYTKPVLFGLQ